MTIANRLVDYLNQYDIQFQLIEHVHSNSSLSTSINADIPMHAIAKAVILEDHEDRKVMAILPANNKVSLSTLSDKLKGHFHLVKEQAIYSLFEDCEHGAIPPMGDAYCITTVCDKLLDKLEYVYLEGGDHKTLIQVSHENFEKIMASAKHFRFSHQVFH